MVTAVYLAIYSPIADELLAVETDVAQSAAVHTSTATNDSNGHLGHASDSTAMDQSKLVMQPRQTIELVPGGMHIMLDGLNNPLLAGESFELTMQFSNAGEVLVPVLVAWNDPFA